MFFLIFYVSYIAPKLIQLSNLPRGLVGLFFSTRLIMNYDDHTHDAGVYRLCVCVFLFVCVSVCLHVSKKCLTHKARHDDDNDSGEDGDDSDFIRLRLPTQPTAPRLTSAMAWKLLPISSFPISVQPYLDGLKRSTCKEKQDIASSVTQHLVSAVIIRSTSQNHLLVQVSGFEASQRSGENLLSLRTSRALLKVSR